MRENRMSRVKLPLWIINIQSCAIFPDFWSERSAKICMPFMSISQCKVSVKRIVHMPVMGCITALSVIFINLLCIIRLMFTVDYIVALVRNSSIWVSLTVVNITVTGERECAVLLVGPVGTKHMLVFSWVGVIFLRRERLYMDGAESEHCVAAQKRCSYEVFRNWLWYAHIVRYTRYLSERLVSNYRKGGMWRIARVAHISC